MSKFVLSAQYSANLPQPIQSRSMFCFHVIPKYKSLLSDQQSYSNIPSGMKSVPYREDEWNLILLFLSPWKQVYTYPAKIYKIYLNEWQIEFDPGNPIQLIHYKIFADPVSKTKFCFMCGKSTADFCRFFSDLHPSKFSKYKPELLHVRFQ